jgi:predicted ATP-grasp superfamily ATP-dependent carboligase
VLEQGVILDINRKAIVLSNDADTIDNNSFLHHVDREGNTSGKLYDRAYVTGISGGLLAACLSNGIACKGLVVPTLANIPDPEGAAILLESVNRLGNEFIKINVDPLRKWAANLKERLQEMNKAILRQQEGQNIDERQQGIYT